MTQSLYAVQHVKKMRGGSQSHLLRASNEGFYVTKFMGNPQHTRVLANEMFASRLGQWLGLPIPEVATIDVSEWLIQNTPELCFDLVGCTVKLTAGRHFGSRYPVDPLTDFVFDHLPESLFPQIRNPGDFARVLVLDKWTSNSDGRQVLFTKKNRQRQYRLSFIDQGYCFQAGEWTFLNQPLQGTYYRNYVYAGVTGWDSFEPVLTKAEEADVLDLWRCAETIPAEWYGKSTGELERLVETLHERRLMIRDLINDFRHTSRHPFPNWIH